MHHITLLVTCFAAIMVFIYSYVLNFDGFVSLDQEITEELGSMSESSDDEFLTTRIVRRRVVIQVSDVARLMVFKMSM